MAQVALATLVHEATLAVDTDDVTVPVTLDKDTKGVRVVITTDVVGAPTSPTFDLKLQRADQMTGAAVDITGAAIVQITADTDIDLLVYPGATAVSNRVVNQPLSAQVINVVIAVGGTFAGGEGITYKVGLQELQ